MRVLLLTPPLYEQRRYGRRPVYPYAPPLGIAYLGAVLRSERHVVRLADTTYWPSERVRRLLADGDWNVVGMTVLSEQRQSARNLCDTIRAECPGALVVLGGAHPTLMTRQVLEQWSCDAVVVGEGERSLPALIHAYERGSDLRDVAGIACRDPHGDVVRTPMRPQIENLDDVPFPAYEDFALDGYELWPAFRSLTTRRDSKEAISMITSRGCTARCGFCSTFVVWKGGWRYRSPKNVVDEMEHLHRRHGKRFFNMADDVFTVDQQRVVEICAEILRRKLDFVWECETRVTDVAPDVLRWMRRAGCHAIAYGVESVGEIVLERIKKDVRAEDIYTTFAWTRAAGIKSKAMLMVGNPGESPDSIAATCTFLERARPDFIQVSLAMIFPGTQLHGWARRQGFIDDAYWLTDRPAPFNTVEHPLRTLRRWEASILMAQTRGMERVLRRLRSTVEQITGVRAGRRGLDLFLGDRHLMHWEYPFTNDVRWFRSELAFAEGAGA
jgi:radical SAM superfamily enzyme YgiQ (UPF0313 family)